MAKARQEHYSDFDNAAWCQSLISDTRLVKVPPSGRKPQKFREKAPNTFFSEVLWTDGTLRSMLLLRRPKAISPYASELAPEADYEELVILSLGTDLEGQKNIIHGGATAAILDQMFGVCVLTCAALESGISSTGRLEVDYKAPIPLPSVVLCRTYITEVEGRKIKAKGVLEDGKGKIYATGKALFLSYKPKNGKEMKL